MDVFRDLRRVRGTFELLPRPGTREADRVPGARERVVLHGTATLDGAPFDSRFLGAVVGRHGLITPCQYTLTRVDNGRFEIPVLGEREASGCGAPDAEALLWTFADNRILFSREAAPWPRTRSATFDATFSSAAPSGALPPRVEFAGEVFRRDGRNLPPGTRVEAYVGSTLCGLASVRRTGSFSGFILSVVGPESIPGCTRGGTIRFRVDGRPAPETAPNEPGHEAALDLTGG
jgi:hypothetical protein